jgi:hypothetical protein
MVQVHKVFELNYTELLRYARVKRVLNLERNFGVTCNPI